MRIAFINLSFHIGIMNRDERIDRLAEAIREKKDGRPELGRFVDILAIQKRLAAIFLDADIKEDLHFAGWKLGERAVKGETADFKKAVELALLKFEEEKFARTEIADIKESEIRFRLRENANCAGLGDLGTKACYFEAGYLTGVVGKKTGKRVICEEERCSLQGNDYCEFVIKVL